MNLMKVKRFKADMKFNVTKSLCMIMSFDEDIEMLQKEIWEAGKARYVRCQVSFHSDITSECTKGEYFFSLDIKINNLMDLFVNEIRTFAKRWRRECYFEEISRSNPHTAWLFYKKTFDNVINGPEIWKDSEFTAQIKGEFSGGESVTVNYFGDGAERVFLNDRYIGRIGEKIDVNREGLYIDDGIGSGLPFFFNPENDVKFPEAEYKKLFSNGELLYEDGINIYNIQNFDGLIEGISMAVEKFLEPGNGAEDR